MKAMEPDNPLSFGDWVQQRRLALGLTRPALARNVNCASVTIKKIEREERRPSRQIAALLAEHLLIPESDRDTFIRMARGELIHRPPVAPDLASLPPFLWPADGRATPEPSLLVDRECELARLAAYLEKALAGKGGIVFVSGEAGDGKTLLTQAFVRQSQTQNPDLIVATGNCNAYTGIGDPYLPFREILELLTGDIASHWVPGITDPTYAERLWRLAPHTIQVLLEAGRDLVGTFVSGPSLLSRGMGAVTAQSQTTFERLQALVARRQAGQAQTHLNQSNLIAQYVQVLQRLARAQPLLLIVDDLQWADSGSISLLFHLSRRLQGHPILLVGIYRAAEVALGRGDARHPLEPLLNEVQHIFGDSTIRLNQADGRAFVDALIDSRPNCLDQPFRDALYRQTGGHPLFTVEMLDGLRDRGDLVQNEAGEWAASQALAWEILPARVEGIIRERIGRLPRLLQELLQIASVMGESFCAEVVASVQGGDERQITSQIGQVLDRQQQLVRVQGSQPIGSGRLSHYRFRHILFQQYLYSSLDPMQQIHLHRAIADGLEERYGEQTHSIASQLARHCAIAGDNPRTLHYLTMAGDQAAAVYATQEAEGYYRRALALATAWPPTADQPLPARQLRHLYSQLGRILELESHHDRAIELYAQMEGRGRECKDDGTVLAALLAQAAIRTTVNFARNPAEGQRLLEEARALARRLGDRDAEAIILWNLLILNAYTGGDLQQRLEYGEQALALARALERPEQLALTLHDIFYAYAGADDWKRARTLLFEARDLWQRLDSLPMLSETLMRLHWSYLVTGDYAQAIAHADEAYRLGQESHNIDAQALSHFMLGFVYWERGQIDRALATMEEDIAIAETVNSLTPLIGTRADLGLLYGESGDIPRGLTLAEQARATAEEQLPILRFWPHAVQINLHLLQGDLVTATELAATLDDYRAVKARFGYMPFMWIRVGLAHGEVALQRGDWGAARALADALYADLCAAGIWYLRPDVLHLKGRALLAQGKPCLAEAQATLAQAQATAESLGSRRALRPILVSLSEIS